jgi:hypothetical protein
MSQADLALDAAVPREVVIAIEAGRAGEIGLNRIRQILTALGGRARLSVWYHGALAERLLDERHARIGERSMQLIQRREFVTASEVTYSEFGERGSIDVLAGYEATGAALVGEVKATIGSLEDTNRQLDVKVRLGPKIVKATFGWWPKFVARVLIVPDDRTIRRIIDSHSATMSAVYPARSREFRAWLRSPTEPISAIWFLSEVAPGDRIAA